MQLPNSILSYTSNCCKFKSIDDSAGFDLNEEGNDKSIIQKLKLAFAIQNFRQYGHRVARINPLDLQEEDLKIK